MNVRGIAMVPSRSRFSPRLLPSTETQLSVWMFGCSAVQQLYRQKPVTDPARAPCGAPSKQWPGGRVVLDRMRVAVVCQLMTADLPQHLTVDEERKAWSLASTSH
jgi:hypothetical protein